MRGAASWARLERVGHLAFAGFELRVLARTASTQDVVRLAARAGAAAGYCCVADEQTAGRGRQGRRWTAPPGSALLCSILVGVPTAAAGGVALAAGLAVRSAVAEAAGAAVGVKWPNDVLCGGRKLAGILCEVVPPASADQLSVVVGMGVNLAAAAVPPGIAATSLEEIAGRRAPPAADFLAMVLPELAERLRRLAGGGVPALLDEWMLHAEGIGAAVTAHGAAGTVNGVAEGIDADGALLIRTPSGLRRLLAGDVHLGPPGAAS